MANFGLDHRGFVIRLVKPDTGAWSKAEVSGDVAGVRGPAARPGGLPVECRLGINPTQGDSAADWLRELSERKRIDIDDEVRELLREGARTLPSTRDAETAPPEGESSVDEREESGMSPRGATWWACNSPYYNANASLFNLPEYVERNNCYCFASNHLANVRFALPGRRGGRPATSITCGGVIDGLRADGWIDGCQINTLTIAMVIWPNMDYHFYRVVTGGADWWWGHKPGGTPARYTDNSNRAIRQPLSPINCDRGPYAHFCGYFYQNNDTAFVA
jgi:hypothetical protein